ncbi:MAG: DUF3419 family protein [Desulfobacteraceae bacterium]|nr:DUF3419 family protein [Desulfobacteraceae bacterium]
MDKIEDRADFDYIRYANCWEDTDILFTALNPQLNQTILSIASAGDNSLALLAGGAKVIAVDLNSSQLACVALRKAAIEKLDHAECLSFLGITPSNNRIGVFDSLKDRIEEPYLGFWQNNMDLVKNGIIHAGKFERYFSYFRNFVLRGIHSKRTIATLLQAKSKKDRMRFYREKWSNMRWKLLFKLFFSRFTMGLAGRDPEFFRYVDVPVSENIFNRTQYALTELETHNNPYLDYILTGNYTHTLPSYLQPDNFKKIKQNIKKITLYQGSVQDAAEHFGHLGFDGFNLSDIFEYLDKETCTMIYQTLLNKANPGARFVYWNMLVPRSCPIELENKIEKRLNLSKKLFLKDKAFFYSNFIIEEIV